MIKAGVDINEIFLFIFSLSNVYRCPIDGEYHIALRGERWTVSIKLFGVRERRIKLGPETEVQKEKRMRNGKGERGLNEMKKEYKKERHRLCIHGR